MPACRDQPNAAQAAAGVLESKEVLALVKASEPDCPPPHQMNAIVENRLRRIRGEIRELQRKAREIEKVRTYVQKRLLGA